MASTTLTRTPSSNGNQKTWTLSCWIKRTGLGGSQTIIDGYYGNSNRYTTIYFDSNDNLDIFSGVYSTSSTSVLFQYTSNRRFRDTNGWYHIVIVCDTTQATAGDRIKLYVNGVRETSFGTETQPAQNGDSFMNVTTSPMRMGVNGLDAVLSHVHFIDGTAYQASTFGSTDSTTGEWKINTQPSVTYGTNGFFIFKDSASVTDQSGNSNNFTVANGTLTQTEDNPSNNFAILNPLDNPYAGQIATFSNGATTGAGTETGFLAGASSIGVSSGKYYAEFKVTGGSTNFQVFGVLKSPVANLGTSAPHDSANFYGVRGVGTKIQPGGGGGETASWTSTWTTNDIISLALDCDNNRLYIAKNGQYADGAGAYNQAFTGSPAFLTLASDETYHLMGASISTGSGVSLTMQANFGNGFFGTTAISSEGTNASGIGKFEYDVPANFTALCTKGLNE